MSKDERPLPCPEKDSIPGISGTDLFVAADMNIRATAMVAHHQSITARCDFHPMCDVTARDRATDPSESAKVHFGSEVRTRREVY